MKENKDYDVQNCDKKVNVGVRPFISDFIAGMFIGVAFIIPGFSGGSVAAILGVYERMISAVANVFKEMKKSIITLLPIGLGLVVGILALIFPLGFFLMRYPLPTVSIFVGLAIGGIPSLTAKVQGRVKGENLAVFLAALTLAALMVFIPVGAEVDLFELQPVGYVFLFLSGMLASCALVVPGISGSMILLILGYYNPIVRLLIDYFFRFKELHHCILVLGVCAAGIGLGFFIISILMKHLLARYPRGTYFAIIGFIVGSLPTVYVSTMKSAGMITQSFELISAPSSPLHYVLCLFLVLLGTGASYAFSSLMKNKSE